MWLFHTPTWGSGGQWLVQASSFSLTSWEVLWGGFAALAGSPPAHFR